MKKWISSARMKLRGLASFSRDEQIRLIRSQLIDLIQTSRVRLFRLRNRLKRRLSGSDAADRMLFKAPERFCTPEAVTARIAETQHSAEKLERLAQIALEEVRDPQVLFLLGGHPASRSAVANVLARERDQNIPAVSQRLSVSANYAANFAAVTAITGDDSALEALRDRLPENLSDLYRQILDSLGRRPTGKPDPIFRGIRDSGLRTHKRHRLVIAETLTDYEDFLPLLANADCVTLIGLNDTFGNSSITELTGQYGIGKVLVEHVRSRLSRFSQDYIDLHLETRDRAIELATFMDVAPELLKDDERPFLQQALADFLFFQTLKPAAVAALLSDVEFDHIVIASQKQLPATSFLQTLSGVDGLIADPRVEMISLSRQTSLRARSDQYFSTLLFGPQVQPIPVAWLPSTENFVATLRRHVVPAMLEEVCQQEQPSDMLFVTQSNPAYDKATASFINSLAKDGSVNVHFVGRNAVALNDALAADRLDSSHQIGIALTPTRTRNPSPALDAWLRGKILAYAETLPAGDKVAHMIRVTAKRIADEVFFSIVMQARTLEGYFSRLEAAGQLPSLVVQTPARAPHIGLYSAAARRHGIPSLALEPNALDSRYARYCKLRTDFYGVFSGFFREQAPGFSIPSERAFVIGSPRILRPKDYDSEAARHAARGRITSELGLHFDRFAATVSFFGQPSAWPMVERVWRGVIEATKQHNIAVLLKPHPEEAPSRLRQYLSIIREMGAEDRVRLVSGGPDEVIAASDIVLTGYSTAAVDSVVLGVPVISVIDGPYDYPLPQDRIVGTVLTHSPDELSKQLADFLDRPEKWKAQADAFLEREPQFVTGTDQPLRDLADQIRAMPAEQAIRRLEDLPETAFLDEPHPTFPV